MKPTRPSASSAAAAALLVLALHPSRPGRPGHSFVAPTKSTGRLARASAARKTQGPSVSRRGAPPRLDYPPPPAASLAWPRYLSWFAATVVAVQGIRRKLFGGAEAVALDPALPWGVRWELIRSRRELRSSAKGAPRAFRRMLRDSADTLEEVPALLVTVAVLAGDALRGNGSLTPFRRLGEAIALLFTAGRLHLGIKDEGGGSMRLLGGDFLYAEGQWMLAELGSLPAIQLTAQMIRDFSDGCSVGGGAANDAVGCAPGGSSSSRVRQSLRAAFIRTGTYFSTVTCGAARLSRAPPSVVRALRSYGSCFGCALQLAQDRRDPASQDCAIWLARAAKEAISAIEAESSSSAALRGMRRLAHRVERSCEDSLQKLLRTSSASEVRGLCFGDFEDLRLELDELYELRGDNDEGKDAVDANSMGFRRDEVASDGLSELIAAGLTETFSRHIAPFPAWPEGGPKVALEAALSCVGRELVVVTKDLDGALLGSKARSSVVRDEVQRLFSSGGKRLRPALTLLIAKALRAEADHFRQVASLAASVEVLHSASLVHDDILDGADVRRGEQTSHVKLGERPATLVGDFLFATASGLVADLGSLPTVTLISKVVADFGKGELAQSAVRFEAVKYSLEDYLAKSFYKTASLLAAACQAAAVLSGLDASSSQSLACYRFGAYVGLAFQVMDDILDFTASGEELGKPALADLKEGNLSAPILFAAAERNSNLTPEERRLLLEALERRLAADGDLDRTISLVQKAGGVTKAKDLARRFVDLAAAELEAFEASESKDALRTFAEFVIARSF